MTDLDALAAALLQAYATGSPVPPLTETFDGLTLDEAYAVQQIQVRDRLAAGAVIAGYKVGLPSEPMRQQFGVGSQGPSRRSRWCWPSRCAGRA